MPDIRLSPFAKAAQMRSLWAMLFDVGAAISPLATPLFILTFIFIYRIYPKLIFA
jgi:hypothetical protein